MLQRLVRAIDRLSGATGFFGSCLVVPLFCVMFYEVALRFFFNLPTFWAYELGWMLTGAHFSLGIGYVLREGGHIRIDFLFAQFGPKQKALLDLLIYVCFLLPAIAWLTWALGGVAIDAYVRHEDSGESAWNPLVWPVRLTVFFGFLVFALQILAETIKAAFVLAGREMIERRS